jgi:hypothetical protein
MEQVPSPESMPPSNVRTALEIRIVRKPQNSPGNDKSTMRESCSESESLTESESSTAGNRKTSGQHDTNADAHTQSTDMEDNEHPASARRPFRMKKPNNSQVVEVTTNKRPAADDSHRAGPKR